MKPDNIVPVEHIKECFEYREEEVDGVLQGNVYRKYRKDMKHSWNARFADKRIGKKHNNRYTTASIKYNGILYSISIHIIVWVINNNCYPKEVIDHIDRNPENNLISNLREASFYLNSLNRAPSNNRTSQYKGLSFKKACNRWEVQYSLNYKDKFVGYFNDEIEAALAYNETVLKNHDPKFVYLNDISNGYTNKEYPNKPRGWKPE